MSWKADLLLLGALGFGAYMVATNLGRISDWLGEQIGRGLIAPTQETINAITEPVYEAGVQAGQFTREAVIEPVYQAGVTTGQAVNLVNRAFSNVVPEAAAQTAAKSAVSFGLATIPVFGPLLSGLFSFLSPPSIDKTAEASTSVISASPPPGETPLPTPPTFVGPSGSFTPTYIGINPAGLPIEVASAYGRPSFIKEEIWPSVREEFTLALMAGANPYIWGYQHGFLPAAQVPAGLL